MATGTILQQEEVVRDKPYNSRVEQKKSPDQ